MLKNAYLLAKIGADTAEHEQHFAETLTKFPSSPERGEGRAAMATASGTALVTGDAGPRSQDLDSKQGIQPK